MEDDDHREWCDQDHEEGEPCASEWRGARDGNGAELLSRVLQRPDEEPVVQISLTNGEQSVIAEFSPVGAPGDRIGGFPELLTEDAGLAWYGHSKTQ